MRAALVNAVIELLCVCGMAAENELGTDYMKFKAISSCTLHDSGGSSMELTDGLYVGYFANL